MKNKQIFSKTLLIFFAIPGGLSAQVHELPKLNYEYSALEPHIDAKTMEVHYTKHHQGYVNKLNAAIKGTEAEKHGLEYLMLNVSKFNTGVRNNGGGHYNHTLFWDILSPNAKSKPDGDLLKMINEEFGDFENLKLELEKAGATQFGSGWAWLILTKKGKLAVVSTPNQDNPLMDIAKVRGIPILGIDVWEHAYYLQYQNKRPDYLNAIWNVLDWAKVEENYKEAVKSKIKLL
ncbi:MAG: superoxide dismutase [Bacteroidales bacterium]|jgi:Fe-Mn family superoxide dismutase|nr:superoxide dismutase [Bacteroidales bacterium]MDD4218491.1 superoxide dismutase [Bacteroidales bacterium]